MRKFSFIFWVSFFVIGSGWADEQNHTEANFGQEYQHQLVESLDADKIKRLLLTEIADGHLLSNDLALKIWKFSLQEQLKGNEIEIVFKDKDVVWYYRFKTRKEYPEVLWATLVLETGKEFPARISFKRLAPNRDLMALETDYSISAQWICEIPISPLFLKGEKVSIVYKIRPTVAEAQDLPAYARLVRKPPAIPMEP